MKMSPDKEKSGIVGFAFGTPRSIPSNNAISMIICKKARELNAPVFVQFDILILDPEIDVFYAKEYAHQALTTYEVASQAIDWAITHNIKKLWIVATPCHFTRCLRDITYVAEQKKAKIKFRICQEIYDKTYEKDWLSKRSEQWWTRNKIFFWIRELPLLLTPIHFYKKITDKGQSSW
mgnify:CR=1 FL=1